MTWTAEYPFLGVHRSFFCQDTPILRRSHLELLGVHFLTVFRPRSIWSTSQCSQWHPPCLFQSAFLHILEAASSSFVVRSPTLLLRHPLRWSLSPQHSIIRVSLILMHRWFHSSFARISSTTWKSKRVFQNVVPTEAPTPAESNLCIYHQRPEPTVALRFAYIV